MTDGGPEVGNFSEEMSDVRECADPTPGFTGDNRARRDAVADLCCRRLQRHEADTGISAEQDREPR